MPQAKQILELEGIITEALPNTMFRVQVAPSAPEEYQGRTILCTLSGKMRLYRIRVMPGDEVRLEMTPYDKDRGRITYRKREPAADHPRVAS
ncbi:translation initiation factor IF-1 [Microgenomates group bacterium RBG_16_45_19]|nr:MAG: translation initiation factor IF-1 [Microgenomates group bacterium RBG_16_45_19]